MKKFFCAMFGKVLDCCEIIGQSGGIQCHRQRGARQGIFVQIFFCPYIFFLILLWGNIRKIPARFQILLQGLSMSVFSSAKGLPALNSTNMLMKINIKSIVSCNYIPEVPDGAILNLCNIYEEHFVPQRTGTCVTCSCVCIRCPCAFVCRERI